MYFIIQVNSKIPDYINAPDSAIMEFFGVGEISLRPAEISAGKKEKKLTFRGKTGEARRMECFEMFSKQTSFTLNILSDSVYNKRRENV